MALIRRRRFLTRLRRGDDDPHRAVVRHRGREITFAIDNPSVALQKHLKRGAFYEAGLQRSHGDLIYRSSTVLDVGANVGNHSVFYALTPASKVYPFEPNPRARELLTTTVGLNDLEEIDLTYVDRALGARPGRDVRPHALPGQPRTELAETPARPRSPSHDWTISPSTAQCRSSRSTSKAWSSTSSPGERR